MKRPNPFALVLFPVAKQQSRPRPRRRLLLVHLQAPGSGLTRTRFFRTPPELALAIRQPEIPLVRRRSALPGPREARRCYAAATSALVPRWRAYMSSTHLNPGRSFSESRNRRDWAVRSSG
jgi:hypothetical protein